MSGQGVGEERRPLRTMPWWIAAIGAVAVVAAATGTTVWLLSIAGHDAQLRIEAIKVGLSVGAGTGGAVALLLAVRRQWLSERTQAHAEDVARDNAHDATERRVTELYGKAVEQLGHANAAVRLGGLYSLERLAQDHREHRQTVVDVVCAYLRMPFEPPPSSPAADHRRTPTEESSAASPGANDARQELQVRLAAQRLLTWHLVPHDTQDTVAWPGARPDSFWEGMRIDLVGAHLVDFGFFGCRPYDANFSAAQFSGDAFFVGARFSGPAWFEEARFSGAAVFERARFNEEAYFERAQFSGFAGFREAQFSGRTVFDGAQFSDEAVFERAQFSGHAGFEKTRFDSSHDFTNATVSDPNDGHTWPEGWRVEESPRLDTARLVRQP